MHDITIRYILKITHIHREAEVGSFIDERCIVFDKSEESKFKYTDIHEEFKQIAEKVFTERLVELGIDEDAFSDACSI